jgi:hypothetical protein
VTIAMRCRATRCISLSPAPRSAQWWAVRTPIAASKESSPNGSDSALACTTGAEPAGRWKIISAEGSTAVTSRPAGS